MYSLQKEKLLIVLAALLILTLLSWLIIYAAKLEPKFLGTVLLLLAFVKVQIIINQYMELNKAIPVVQIAFWLWTAGVCAMSIFMYWR
jgi:hypothetical protein